MAKLPILIPEQNKFGQVKLLAKSFNPLASLLDGVAAVDELRF